MLDVRDITFIVSWSITTGLVLMSMALERRYAPLTRREMDRALALYGYFRVPIFMRIVGTCPYRVLWLAIIHAGWLILWFFRCEERRATFAIDERRYSVFIALVALTSATSVVSFWLDCPNGEFVVAFVFASAWICVTIAAYALERHVPRPYRERELIMSVGVCLLAQVSVSPFIGEPWDGIITCAAQLFIAGRLLIPDVKHAIAGDKITAFCETIYDRGGPIYCAAEALRTPLEHPFIAYCEGEDAEATRAYQEANDRDNGAVLDHGCMDPRVAARALERFWPGFVKYLNALPTSRRYYTLDEEDSSEEEEEEVQYVSLSAMKGVE